MSEAEIDAVVLLRPKNVEKLRPFLDLDEEEDEADESDDDENDALYAEALDDGSFLVFTFQPYAAFEQDEDAARDWLAQFGDALPDIHHDPRGVLFFPDSCEPDGSTYDAVVAEIGERGIWVALDEDEHGLPPGFDASQLAALGLPPGMDINQLAAMIPPGVDINQLAAMVPPGMDINQLAGMVPPGVDVAQLEQMAAELLGNASNPSAPTTFELGKLFEGMQQQLLDAFSAQVQAAHEGEDEAPSPEALPPNDSTSGTPKPSK
ncbi:hypothetical protein [Pendulispora albinea]|uniref:Uncharacterized protein n=1 Tax=Pendulispora albinea TaxID=2741071 RepID=A0ABZ2LMH0_9BACT